MNIVILDAYTTNPGDLNWDGLKKLGKVTMYDRTSEEQVISRAKGADILISNKVVFDRKTLLELPDLKCICVLATGYNNVDVEFAKEQNISVSNVVGYSTDSVAQHVFALILALTNRVETHSLDVDKGSWENAKDWTYQLFPLIDLNGKTLGIYGFGKIGQRVGEIGKSFGMKIISAHKHPQRDKKEWVEFVTENELFLRSDFLTLHASLNASNEFFVNETTLGLMKKTAFLINTGRGGLINEKDLKETLENNKIAGAGLDVLSTEPPKNGNILIGTKNCLITPHQAWGSFQSRKQLIEETTLNVKAFIDGKPRNVVNLL
ncbi:MAG: D-2-hydroxyacid dehydrogenase [Bacteroidetes bacterium]|jgi:glycerate dehydrogenase|nr:D-2-hydroxyacid dehydrogenase [Bacteroidota bacterium]MDF1867515.1 D-2-hydroxyacid dehydrogenase [Saprospiraceae bacterium]